VAATDNLAKSAMPWPSIIIFYHAIMPWPPFVGFLLACPNLLS